MLGGLCLACHGSSALQAVCHLEAKAKFQRLFVLSGVTGMKKETIDSFSLQTVY